MSSSYSSLDWALWHWAHFTVCRLICVYVCVFCFILHSCCIIVSTVEWTLWDWRLILWPYLRSVLWHCWLAHWTHKNPSPVWPIMCLVGRYTLLRLYYLYRVMCVQVWRHVTGSTHWYSKAAHGAASCMCQSERRTLWNQDFSRLFQIIGWFNE